jgi:hypothetical protein
MSEHDNGWDFAKRLSEALLKVRPLGGSEMFVKRNNQYYADPDYCARVIDEMRDNLHKERLSRVRLEKALETAATRFNLMAGVGLVNGSDPKVGYRECMDVLGRVKGAPDHG